MESHGVHAHVTRPTYGALCLAGGGVGGTAYVGALQELARAGAIDWLSPQRDVQLFVGTSVGALFALLLYVKVDLFSHRTTDLVQQFLQTLRWHPDELVRDLFARSHLPVKKKSAAARSWNGPSRCGIFGNAAVRTFSPATFDVAGVAQPRWRRIGSCGHVRRNEHSHLL